MLEATRPLGSWKQRRIISSNTVPLSEVVVEDTTTQK